MVGEANVHLVVVGKWLGECGLDKKAHDDHDNGGNDDDEDEEGGLSKRSGANEADNKAEEQQR